MKIKEIFQCVKKYNNYLNVFHQNIKKDHVLKDNILLLLFGSILIKNKPDAISTSQNARYNLCGLIATSIILMLFVPILIIYVNIFSIFADSTWIFKVFLWSIPLVFVLLGAILSVVYVSLLKSEFDELLPIKKRYLFICDFLKVAYWIAGIVLTVIVYFLFKIY